MSDEKKLIATVAGVDVEIVDVDGKDGKAYVTRLGDPHGITRVIGFSHIEDVRVVDKNNVVHYGKPHFLRVNGSPQQIVDHVEYWNKTPKSPKRIGVVAYVTVRDHPGTQTAPEASSNGSGGLEAMKKPAELILSQE